MKPQSETQPKPSLTLAIYDLTRKKLPELAKKMDMAIDREWNVEFGKKYAKITESHGIFNGTKSNSVWGFVVLKSCTVGGIDYKPGDLLKAASYSKPAKHSRGNIMEGTSKYNLWGPDYLQNSRTI
jgi:hypothetical protein